MKFPEFIHGINAAELIGLSMAIFLVGLVIGFAAGAILMRQYVEELPDHKNQAVV